MGVLESPGFFVSKRVSTLLFVRQHLICGLKFFGYFCSIKLHNCVKSMSDDR